MRATILFAPLLCILCAIAPARAEWIAYDTPDPNGGARTILAGQTERGAQIQVVCNATGRSINFLYPVGVTLTEGDTVDLNFLTDNGQVWSGPATTYLASGGFFVLSYRSTAHVDGLVRDLIAAQSELVVTITGPGGDAYDVYSGNVKGSSAAGRSFLAACPGPPVAPPTVSTATNWTYQTYPGNPVGTTQASVLGNLDRGGYLAAYCLGPSTPALVFLSENPSTFPYEEGDMGLQIHLEIDGQDLSSVGEYLLREDGMQSVIYTGSDHLESIFERLGNAQSEVAVTIKSYSNEVTTRWPAIDLNGLAGAMASLRASCFGGALPSAQPPPAVAQPTAPSVTGVPWVVKQLVGGVGGNELVGTSIDGSTLLFFSCGTDGNKEVTILSDDGFSDEAKAPPVRFALNLDGRIYHITDGIFEEGPSDMVYGGMDGSANDVAIGMASGPAAMSVLVGDAESEDRFEREMSVRDIAASVSDFVGACARAGS